MYLQFVERSLILLRFFKEFSYIIDDHSYLKNCISTKLSQIVCLINVHILECKYAKCDCIIWKVLLFNCVFREFSYIITCLKRYNFTKLLQIACLGRTVGKKVNLCNYLYLYQSEFSLWKLQKLLARLYLQIISYRLYFITKTSFIYLFPYS